MCRELPVAKRKAGIRQSQVYSMIRNRKIQPPERDGSGDFIWSDADVVRIETALRIGRRAPLAGPYAGKGGTGE